MRTATAAKQAIDNVYRRVRWFRGLEWAPGTLTKEALINASWLWLDSQTDAKLMEIFGPSLRDLAAAMEAEAAERTEGPEKEGPGGEDPPESRPGGSVPINPPKPPRRPKR